MGKPTTIDLINFGATLLRDAELRCGSMIAELEHRIEVLEKRKVTHTECQPINMGPNHKQFDALKSRIAVLEKQLAAKPTGSVLFDNLIRSTAPKTVSESDQRVCSTCWTECQLRDVTADNPIQQAILDKPCTGWQPKPADTDCRKCANCEHGPRSHGRCKLVLLHGCKWRNYPSTSSEADCWTPKIKGTPGPAPDTFESLLREACMLLEVSDGHAKRQLVPILLARARKLLGVGR